MRKILIRLIVVATLLFAATVFLSGRTNAEIFADFQTPPHSVRPHVYWFVMDGNLTREGITADFEAMRDAGIGGFIMMEVNLGVPRGTVDFMSPAWQSLFVHIVREAERCGLQMTLPSGPGWAGSGGPWIAPEDSMLHLTTTQTTVSGPQKISLQLPTPKPLPPFFGEGALPEPLEQARREFFRDVCVLAFPTPQENEPIPDIQEKAFFVRAPYSSAPNVRAGFDSPVSGDRIDSGISDIGIDAEKIVDLTEKMTPQGELVWDVPPGDWTILRFAATSTGANTRPAPIPGMGLESSKLDTDAFDLHAEHYIEQLLRAVGERRTDGEAGWCAFHIDSWEMGPQNYSPTFFDEFFVRRGYSIQPFLPTYAGHIVGSVELTERFLWDLRQTVQELMIQHHAEHLAALAHRNGLLLSLEPYDMMPCCDMTFGRSADVPMGEFWSNTFDTAFSCFEAASVAHTNGRPIVGAEAFTSGSDAWRENPRSMKQRGDWAFCTGINRIVFHRFQHQPELNRVPGFSMGTIGIHYERTQSWWPLVGGYHRYLARCQFLLRQGRPVADILYLLPEGAPRVFTPPESALRIDGTIKDQRGYRFDGCDPVSLIQNATVEQGEIVFSTGTASEKNAARYALLVLPNVETMTPALLEKLEGLVRAGGTVVGNPPVASPSLSGYPATDAQVRALAESIWGGTSHAANGLTFRRYAAGTIYTPPPLDGLYPEYEVTEKILAHRKRVPDFWTTDEEALRFFHRQTSDADYYFVSNRRAIPFFDDVTFRATAATVSLWDPLTGERFRPLQTTESNGTTTLKFFLDGNQSVFVVLNSDEALSDAPVWKPLDEENGITLDEGWGVTFDAKLGGPQEPVTLETLRDWTTCGDTKIEYYSGVARYARSFDWDAPPAAGTRIFLDLGEVEVMARVFLNGEEIGTRWIAPYRFDLSSFLQKGQNELVVEVANLWVNRFIGDASLPESERVTWSTWPLGGYTADSPLMPSGLLGPVRIVRDK